MKHTFELFIRNGVHTAFVFEGHYTGIGAQLYFDGKIVSAPDDVLGW